MMWAQHLQRLLSTVLFQKKKKKGCGRSEPLHCSSLYQRNRRRQSGPHLWMCSYHIGFLFFFLKVKNHTVTIDVRHRKRWLKEGEKERSSTVHLCKVIKQKSNMTETETVPETKLKFTQCLLTNTGFEMSQTHGDSRRSFYSSMLEWADQ